MNRYLNKQAKLDLTMMGYMASCLLSMRDRFDTPDWSKESKTAIKTAATWADKAFAAVCDQLAPEEGRTLVNNLKSLIGGKMRIEPHTVTKKDTAEKYTDVANDDLLDLAEEVIEQNCKLCFKNKPNQECCAIRGFFHKYDVEPVDFQTVGCPYKYKEVVKSAG